MGCFLWFIASGGPGPRLNHNNPRPHRETAQRSLRSRTTVAFSRPDIEQVLEQPSEGRLRLEEEVEGVTRLFRENLFQGVKATSGSVRMTYLTFLFLNPASRDGGGTGREGRRALGLAVIRCCLPHELCFVSSRWSARKTTTTLWKKTPDRKACRPSNAVVRCLLPRVVPAHRPAAGSTRRSCLLVGFGCQRPPAFGAGGKTTQGKGRSPPGPTHASGWRGPRTLIRGVGSRGLSFSFHSPLGEWSLGRSLSFSVSGPLDGPASRQKTNTARETKWTAAKGRTEGPCPFPNQISWKLEAIDIFS